MTNNAILIFEFFKFGGVAEVDGTESNPLLLSIIKKHVVTVTDDSAISWCGIMMGEVFDRCGLNKPISYISARSWLNVGEDIGIKEATPGDLVIFSRPPSTWQGHVGLYVWHNETHIMTYAGNQSNKVGFALYPIDRLLGIRRI